MVIEIRLYANLRKYSEQANGVLNVEVPEGTTMLELIEMLEIDEHEIKMIMINGKSADINYILTDEDRVGLFPPVGGG